MKRCIIVTSDECLGLLLRLLYTSKTEFDVKVLKQYPKDKRKNLSPRIVFAVRFEGSAEFYNAIVEIYNNIIH